MTGGVGWRLVAAIFAALFLSLSASFAEVPATAGNETGTAERPLSGFEEALGIKILSIRLTAKGNIVDFRYRLLDPEKAKPLFDYNVKPHLLDAASGRKLGVPTAPKIGALRTTKNPVAGKNYFMLFGNTSGTVKKGSKVSIVVGDLKSEEIVIE